MGKKIKDVSKVKKTDTGVVVEIVDKSVKEESVKEIVENCQTGKCDCMSGAVKEKVEFINFIADKGKIAIEINGDITEEDIKEALSKSKKEF